MNKTKANPGLPILEKEIFGSENRTAMLFPLRMIAFIAVISGSFALIFAAGYFNNTPLITVVLLLFMLTVALGIIILTYSGKNLIMFSAAEMKNALAAWRKQTEDELSFLVARYKGLFESAKDGIIILDAETGKIIDVNPFLIELLGYSKEHFLEKEIWDIGSFEDIAANKEKFSELQMKKYVRYENLPLETASGQMINVEFVSNVYLVNQKKVIQCKIRDITERKEIEVGLEKTRKELAVIKKSADESREYSESIINTLREPLIALDENLRVVSASRSFYDVFNVNPADTIGKLIYDLGNQQWNIPKLRELLETILPDKTTFNNYEVEHDFSTIGRRVMLLNARQIQRGSGKERIILLAIEDITVRKIYENELSKAKAEAERANVAKSEFLSRMSHELRTPMNSILGFAQLMDMGDMNPAHKKGISQILKSGKHLLDLINEVLDLAKIEAGRMTVSPEPVEIFSVIRETIDIVSNLAVENQVIVEFETPVSEKLFVKADHQRLKQVLLNLINNAVKYNRTGGFVNINCSIKQPAMGLGPDENEINNLIRISVVDTGNGIEKESIKKLFNPFERINAEGTETEGTGLGLAISKKLVEAMHGTIGVESELGRGSIFWIDLPQMESQKDSFERLSGKPGKEIEPISNTGTVLYIEDNLSNIQLVEQILEVHRPMVKLITNSYGKNAVQLAIDYKPDLILLDLDLPDIHGSRVISLLLAEPQTAKIPVIILSADAITRQIGQLLELGAKDYMIKPIDVIHFLNVVDNYLIKEVRKQ